MSFWIVISLAALIASVLLALVLLRRNTGDAPAAAYDLQVYRDQLKEVDRDLARGIINEADAERVRTEISRRILAADAEVRNAAAGRAGSRRATMLAAALLGVAMIGGSMWLYRDLGAPGYGDLPQGLRIEMAEERRAGRPGQEEAEARMPPRETPEVSEDYAKLLEQLRRTAGERPDDLQGQSLLARHEANVGNFSAAAKAQSRVLEIKGDEATALDYAEHAELLVLAAGGYVSPEAEASLKKALEMEPRHGPSRYYWGLLMGQIGRPDLGFEIWDETLRTSPPEAGWVPAIRAQIPEMAWRAGVDYTLPPAGPGLTGPSEEDMAAAADMSPEERQEMIRGMVDRLMSRLAGEGGPPNEWARLIGALGVLGDTERAQAIYDEALRKFAASPEAVAELRAAAQRAGLVLGEAPGDAGLRPPTAEELAGPSQEDVDAAAEMEEGDRQEMIRGMVDRLMQRLATEGGTPPEWARLITSLSVLGDTEQAQAIYEEALEKFAGSEAELAVIRQAGQQAGLGE